MEVYCVLLSELPPKHPGYKAKTKRVFLKKYLAHRPIWMLDYPDTTTYWVRAPLASREFGLTLC